MPIAGSRIVRIKTTPFPGRMSYVVSELMFCLLVVLVISCQYLPSDWLERLDPLRKPNRGEGILSTKPRLKSVYDFLVL